MLLSKLFLLPAAVASSVTVYMHSVPSTSSPPTAVVPSPIPLVQISYDVEQTSGTVVSYTPPQGSYAPDHLMRIGLHDIQEGIWKGILTSAASFADEYTKKFVVHLDEKGEPYHVGFSTSDRGAGEELNIEVVRKAAGPKPVLNKPVVLNADGRIDSKEPEKTFLQK
ncbi:hypothetical protein SLS60_001511 [Paraconiothyrium brasiliense]|uniref:Uncharacterized protein n=1 Tax=Paraconiothyrium brasiliense TaxID=300254 RepID=A0ABR3RZJ9_9PLEO